MPHPLDGIWEKIKRADEHINNLNLDIISFLNSNVYKIIGHSQADAREYVMHKVGKPPPIRFSVIAGEIIHQCRSALDHLVWQLVLANKGKPSDRHEFPICPTPKKFVDACTRGKIKGISASAAEIIASLQPYRNPKGLEQSLLWILHRMDIDDKHRMLIVVTARVSPIPILYIDPGQPNISILGFSKPKGPARPSDDDTEVFRIRTAEPAPQMNVQVDSSAQIAFEQYGPYREQPVMHCVTELRNFTVGTIRKFAGELRRHTS